MDKPHIWLIVINAVSVLWVAYYAAGRLSLQFGRRTLAQGIAHTLMLGGALAVVGVMIQDRTPHHWTEILFNFGVAVYFFVRDGRRIAKNKQMRGIPQGIRSDLAKSYIQQGKSKC